MLLVVAFALFALMLVSWFVAPSAEKPAPAVKDAPAGSPVGAAMQH